MEVAQGFHSNIFLAKLLSCEKKIFRKTRTLTRKRGIFGEFAANFFQFLAVVWQFVWRFERSSSLTFTTI